ncbi:hypothetical protein [Treponema bryantii]|uniref:hypothetical protein n=1 Tax=Treponema bryantii TaxID=163 RepID=UPI0003B5FD70|nr:hypothetical protein [Treponema bryantii]
MIKFLVIVFLVVFVIPSMIFSLWSYFDQKKKAKNPKAQPRPQNLTHAQMMALLEPDGLQSIHRQEAEAQSVSQPVTEPVPQPAPHRVEEQAEVKSAPHEVQTIVLKREIYY